MQHTFKYSFSYFFNFEAKLYIVINVLEYHGMLTCQCCSVFADNYSCDDLFQGLIFVVDSNDRERVEEARAELKKMVNLFIKKKDETRSIT